MRGKKEMAKRTRGKYGYFSIVIHRARIFNYNDGWGKGPGPTICVVCARLCEKFAGRGREWRGFSHTRYSPRGSSGAMIYHRLLRTCTPAKLFFFRNVDRRYFYILIDLQLSNWHQLSLKQLLVSSRKRSGDCARADLIQIERLRDKLDRS